MFEEYSSSFYFYMRILYIPIFYIYLRIILKLGSKTSSSWFFPLNIFVDFSLIQTNLVVQFWFFHLFDLVNCSVRDFSLIKFHYELLVNLLSSIILNFERCRKSGELSFHRLATFYFLLLQVNSIR